MSEHRAVIVGCGLTRFGRRDEAVTQLMVEASRNALSTTDLDGENIWFDEVVVANMACGEFEGSSGIANALTSQLSLEPAYSVRVENVSGSGGSALMYAQRAIQSGRSKRVLVVGGEKMSSQPTEKVTSIVASLAHPLERDTGITLPAYAGLLARTYLSVTGAPRESLAEIAVKNHYNGSLNPYAQFQKPITIEKVLSSPLVADPLRLYDFCPISDGAAAVIMVSGSEASTIASSAVEVLSIEGAAASHSVAERMHQNALECVHKAGQKAYGVSGLAPADIGVAEVHDMATVLEALQLEELGFYPKGSGWKGAVNKDTSISGSLPVNTSGGLKSKGHPIGASGVAQAAETYMQLTGKAGARQVKAEHALTLSMGGFGNSAVVGIYGKWG